MRGFILILIHSIAIIECENQVSANIVQYPKDLNVQLDPPKINSQTRYESSNQKLHLKSPGNPSKHNCPEKTNFVFLSIDDRRKVQRRSAYNGWLLERPFYVDEPSWVLLSESNTNLMSNNNKLIKQAEQDPFYLARGKKSADNLMNLPVGNNNGDRKKHSDILDLIHEPFFISRGKKKSENYYGDYSSRVNENNNNNRGIYLYDKRNEGTDNNNGYKLSEYDDDTDNSSRGRRGDFFDQLLKENDPFYVTRG